MVYKLNIATGERAEKFRSTSDHRGSTVTTLCWRPDGNCFYVGDNAGKVTQVNVTSKVVKTI